MLNKIKIGLLIFLAIFGFINFSYVKANVNVSIDLGGTMSSDGNLRNDMINVIDDDNMASKYFFSGKVTDLALDIKKILYTIAFIIAVAAIVWAGVRMVTANGNPEAFKKAWMHLLYIIIGLLIIFFAWGLVYFVFNIKF